MDLGIKHLESSGFKVHTGPHVYHRCDYLAGEDAERLADFHGMFLSEEITAIFCSRGGYGSLRLLNKIDYHLVRNHPKILIGYSDITALLMALYQQIGLVTFHGPMLFNWSRPSRTHMYGMLSENKPATLRWDQGDVLLPGRAVGTLLGGNLSLICHLAGTPFLPSLKGAILCVEDRGEPLYRVDRMLTHLALTGQVQGLAAVIAGQFVDCGDKAAINRLFESRFAGNGVPVITGFPMGHGSENLTIPMGIQAELNTDAKTLRTLEPHLL